MGGTRRWDSGRWPGWRPCPGFGSRARELRDERPYLRLWLAGCAFWLAAIYWLCLPYWATCFGWFAISLYLGAYLPAFVAFTRVGVHRLRWPIVFVTVVWTGLELVRGYFGTGFLIASISHTQFRWIELIQISDVAGQYGVDFLVIFGAACVARMLPLEGKPWTLWPLAPLAAGLVAVLAYGSWRMSDAVTQPGPKVAIIQGSIDSEMKAKPAARAIFNQYLELSERAVRETPDVDLIVWPETMFRLPLVSFDEEALPADDPEEAALLREDWTESDRKCRELIAALARRDSIRRCCSGSTRIITRPKPTRITTPPSSRIRKAPARPLRQDPPGDVRRVRAVCQGCLGCTSSHHWAESTQVDWPSRSK